MPKFLKSHKKIIVAFSIVFLLLLFPVQASGCPGGGFCAYQENGQTKYPENLHRIPLFLFIYEAATGQDSGFHY